MKGLWEGDTQIEQVCSEWGFMQLSTKGCWVDSNLKLKEWCSSIDQENTEIGTSTILLNLAHMKIRMGRESLQSQIDLHLHYPDFLELQIINSHLLVCAGLNKWTFEFHLDHSQDQDYTQSFACKIDQDCKAYFCFWSLSNSPICLSKAQICCSTMLL